MLETQEGLYGESGPPSERAATSGRADGNRSWNVGREASCSRASQDFHAPGTFGRHRFGQSIRRRHGLTPRVAASIVLVALAVMCAFLPPFSLGSPGTASPIVRNAPGIRSLQSGGSDPTASVNPTSGLVASEFTVSGGGFLVGTLDIYFNGSGETDLLSVTCTADADGDYSCPFQVPAFPAAQYYVNVTQLLLSASTNFTILEPTVTVFPGVGQVFSNSTATGSGFEPAASASLNFDGVAVTSCESGSSLTVNSGGDFSCTFAIPAVQAGESYKVVATDGINSNSTTFTVNPPTDGLTPTSGAVGATVRATGAGFNANSVLGITFGTTPITSCSSGSTSSNPYGDLSCEFPVPDLKTGTYDVNISDSVNKAAPASFAIGAASLSLSLTSGSVGSSTTASGSGFATSSLLTLQFSSTPVTQCISGALTTDSSGDFSCTFAVPASTSGVQTVSVSDTVNAATASFTVVANLSLSPDNGSFDQSITATGTGFDALASVAVAWNSTYALCTGAVATTGSFACSFQVPNAPYGPQVITATEGSNTPTATFQVEPQVLLNSSTVLAGQGLVAEAFGFDPSASITILWDHLTAECAGSSTDTNGDAFCLFAVPPAPGGENTVSFVQGALESNQTVVVNSSFAIYPPSGVIGTSVQLIGFGFDAATIYVACFETTATSCPSGTAFTTAANGSIPASTDFTIPSDPPGNYYLVDSLGTSLVGVANFTITTSAVLLTPHSGPVGTSVLASGVGFDPDTSFTLTWNSTTTLCAGMTNSTGGFSCTFVVPNAPGGSHAIVLTEGSFAPTADFDLLPSLAISPSTAQSGTTVTVTGSGFAADTAYTVSWPPTGTLCAGTTNGNGAFACSFVVRSVTPGIYSITGSQGASLPSVSIFVIGPSNGPTTTSLLAWALIGIGVLVAAAVGLWVYSRSRRGASARRPAAPAGNAPSPPTPKPVRPTARVASPPPEGALYERLAPYYRDALKPKAPAKTRESSAKTAAPLSPK
jgi:hypothetical protein